MVWGTAVLLSKESWLDTGATTPSATPRVVSFFSFKGGVGRTTTLGCVAARLAARGKKVVAVDLDLEAPGLGVLFDVPTSPGVVDHVLSHLATGDVGEVQPRQVDGISNLWVVPAGELGSGYLEKISRLDFLAGLAAGAASPVESALNALLAAISASVEPDVILLDSRAGLHDMGGLALHRLAHTDVLVARAGEQARAGMGVVLDAIRRLRPNPNDRDVRLVQTMVPMPFDSDVGRPVVDRWRTQMYDLCTETIYEGLDEIPAVNEEVAHFPLLVGHRDELTRVDRLSQIEAATIATFDGIADRLLAPLDEDEGD
jgi:cellulose biosynthesis protein BcsQ